MGLFGTLILIVIFYYCFKAVRSIWRDAFGGVGTSDHDQQKQYRGNEYRNQKEARHNSNNTQSNTSPRIQQDEGEYVDFDETR